MKVLLVALRYFTDTEAGLAKNSFGYHTTHRLHACFRA
ncbi:MAG: hypothetical protein UY21_C0021G0032 [Microgenomates group bacterium GW2011_GWA1_48_10]|nr:MAG: hypothetical protein UY21_C0021G0032 [Microgenomates group bacterium GW2011_GWA1_48_10]